MEWRRGLRDLLAVPTGELLAHRLDDLPRPGDHLQRLGHILAELREARAATCWARARCRDHDACPRQALGEWLPDRSFALERGDVRCLRRSGFGGEIVFGRVRLQVFELELELREQPLGAFGAGAVLLAPELGDLELEMGDHRFGGTLPGTGIGELGLCFGSALNGRLGLPGRLKNQRLERFHVVRQG